MKHFTTTLILILLAGIAAADDGIGFSPAGISLSTLKGGQDTAYVMVFNPSPSPITVVFEPSDSLQGIIKTPDPVEIPGKGQMRVAVTTKPPQHLPQDTYEGYLYGKVENGNGGATVEVSSGFALMVTVKVDASGIEIYDFDVRDFEVRDTEDMLPTSFGFTFESQANVYLDAEVKAVVTDLTTKDQYPKAYEPRRVMPGEILRLDYILDGRPPGKYRVDVMVEVRDKREQFTGTYEVFRTGQMKTKAKLMWVKVEPNVASVGDVVMVRAELINQEAAITSKLVCRVQLDGNNLASFESDTMVVDAGERHTFEHDLDTIDLQPGIYHVACHATYAGKKTEVKNAQLTLQPDSKDIGPVGYAVAPRFSVTGMEDSSKFLMGIFVAIIAMGAYSKIGTWRKKKEGGNARLS